jgi:translation elongation factor EF-Tu-like GTPase
MPHAVVEGTTEYLGVRFLTGPEVAAGEPGVFTLSLMYHPEVDYSALKPGVKFSIREGGKVVATGHVVKQQ